MMYAGNTSLGGLDIYAAYMASQAWPGCAGLQHSAEACQGLGTSYSWGSHYHNTAHSYAQYHMSAGLQLRPLPHLDPTCHATFGERHCSESDRMNKLIMSGLHARDEDTYQAAG